MSGLLKGVTILRFAHAFETGGGVERYLDDLDRVLLERNPMRIIRLYIATDRNQLAERVESIGQGELILVPLPLPEGDSIQSASDEEPSGLNLRRVFRDWVLYSPFVWNVWTRNFLLNWRVTRSRGQVIGARAKVEKLMVRYRIDLIMLHFMGGSDADEIVELARRRGVPFAVLNHYSNDRFLHLSIRKHALLADGVASVNGLGVPRYLRGCLQNLADGIDTEFLRPEKAAPLPVEPVAPVILLPARIVRTKGHLDLVRAGAILRSRGMDFRIAFAGRVDSARFEQELREEIKRYELADRVQFLGVLSQEKLRDWYAASTVVAFPTYHHEGLPRVILETQAMKLPPVAYATGGVPEGLIPGRTGFLLRTGDVEGLAARIGELIKNPELRKRMGEEGRRFVEERYSLEALARRHEIFYTSVIAAGNNSKAIHRRKLSDSPDNTLSRSPYTER